MKMKEKLFLRLGKHYAIGIYNYLATNKYEKHIGYIAYHFGYITLYRFLLPY